MRLVAGIALFALLVGSGGGPAVAEQTWPPAGTEVLAVQQGQKATFDGDTLTVHDAGKTLWFTDRPQRLYGGVDGVNFVAAWQPGGTFASDPPNAALISEDGELSDAVLFVLDEAEQTKDGFRYRVRVLSGDMPEAVERPSLFVDAGTRDGGPAGPGGGW